MENGDQRVEVVGDVPLDRGVGVPDGLPHAGRPLVPRLAVTRGRRRELGLGLAALVVCDCPAAGGASLELRDTVAAGLERARRVAHLLFELVEPLLDLGAGGAEPLELRGLPTRLRLGGGHAADATRPVGEAECRVAGHAQPGTSQRTKFG